MEWILRRSSKARHRKSSGMLAIPSYPHSSKMKALGHPKCLPRAPQAQGEQAGMLSPWKALRVAFLARVDGFDGYGDIVELGGDDTRAATAGKDPVIGKVGDKNELSLILSRRGNDSQASERELVLITDLPNYRVLASGGSSSIIATELDDIPVAIKTIDTCKKPEL
ncbi:hypothetical protein Ae201684P_000524 [Aphanomyces euteiches]|nr:hypothetical protein Ae201684P_000524 [Aphanomyces euteiches]